MPKKEIQRLELKTTTTGLQTSPVASVSVPLGTVGVIKVTIIGKDQNGIGCSFMKVITVQNVAGVVTIIGGAFVVNPHKGAGLSGSNLIEAVSGPNIIVNVIGALAKNIEWWGQMAVILN